jgi:SAM-dependent methyltransferase
VEGPSTPDRAAYEALYDSGRGAEVERARHGVYAVILARFLPWGARRCLDVGSGSGGFVALASQAGWDCVGVDPAGPEGAADEGVRLVRAPFPPAPAGRFELVTFFNSLNYMREPVAALAAAGAALAPGGRVVVRVPNVDFHLAVRRIAAAAGARSRLGEWLMRGTILHARSFSVRALRVAFARAGFRSAGVEGGPLVPGDPYATGARAIRGAKAVVAGASRACEALTGGRLVLASALLATAWDHRPPASG